MKGQKQPRVIGSLFPDRYTPKRAVGLIEGSKVEITIELTVENGIGMLSMSPFYIFGNGQGPQVLFEEVRQILFVPPGEYEEGSDQAGTCFQINQRNESFPPRPDFINLREGIKWNLLWRDALLAENYANDDYSFAKIKPRVGRPHVGIPKKVPVQFDFQRDVYLLESYLFYYKSSGVDNWKFFGFDLSQWNLVPEGAKSARQLMVCI